MKTKRLVIFFLVIVACSTAIQAQKTNSPYLFNDFENAKVYFSNGQQSDEKGQVAAYGGTSELSNTKSYIAKKGNENISILKDMEFEVASYYNYYWIMKDGKRKQFKSFAQFLKLYPKQKDALNQYIQNNHINFEDTEAIVKLCLYAENL